MNIVESVDEFLLKQNLTRMNLDEISEIHGEEIVKLYTSGVPIDETPEYYDIFQSYFPLFDLRRAFLVNFSELLNDLDVLGNTSIVDAGCASGIDIAYLAKLNRSSSFFGYDRTPGIIELAKKRSKRMGLNNLAFKTMTHQDFSERTSQKSDLVYVKMSLDPKSGTFEELADISLSIASQVRPEGFFVQLGSDFPQSYLTQMKEGRLELVDKQFLIRDPKYDRYDMFNYVFLKNK